MRFVILTLLAFASLTASAELKLVVNGPVEAKVGQAVILNTQGTVANAKAWILPAELDGKVLQCTDQLGFFPETAGTYRLILHGTDGMVLDHYVHSVVVSGSAPVDPDKPPTDPPSDGDFASLEQLSRSLSVAVGDTETRGKLGARILEVNFDQPPGDVDREIDRVIRRVFAEIPRDSNDFDWHHGWYNPILQELSDMAASGQISDLSDLKKAMTAVARGLAT